MYSLTLDSLSIDTNDDSQTSTNNAESDFLPTPSPMKEDASVQASFHYTGPVFGDYGIPPSPPMEPYWVVGQGYAANTSRYANTMATGYSQSQPGFVSNACGNGDQGAYPCNPVACPRWPSPMMERTESAAMPSYEQSFESESSGALHPTTPVANVEDEALPRNIKPKSESPYAGVSAPARRARRPKKLQSKSGRKADANGNRTYSRSRTYSSSTQGEVEDLDHPSDRATQVKERNRESANKFRLKKKATDKEWEEREKILKKNNRELEHQAAELRRKAQDLKTHLLQHANCDCTLIQEYINNSASRFVIDKINQGL